VERRGWRTVVTPHLAEFLAGLDMFYLGTASAEGQPYIQHRGGPPGFLRVLDDRTFAFADFGGNRQYITLGNLSENPRAFIVLMDYANRRRVKLWGTARVVDDAPELLERLSDPDYSGKVERAIVFTVETWDINCHQHLAMEYAKDGIRVNAVAPGVVDTPMHNRTPKDMMESLSPMGRPSTVKDITDAVMYLTDAATVTAHILYVDGGAHFGRW
jgi:predicted pyridoxine 5'-phosphate oxidase superfamily flavin-nucleotide-binding protein